MKKFKRLFCIVCMLVLSLAACGKQDTDDGVKKFYNRMMRRMPKVEISTLAARYTKPENAMAAQA